MPVKTGEYTFSNWGDYPDEAASRDETLGWDDDRVVAVWQSILDFNENMSAERPATVTILHDGGILDPATEVLEPEADHQRRDTPCQRP